MQENELVDTLQAMGYEKSYIVRAIQVHKKSKFGTNYNFNVLVEIVTRLKKKDEKKSVFEPHYKTQREVLELNVNNTVDYRFDNGRFILCRILEKNVFDKSNHLLLLHPVGRPINDDSFDVYCNGQNDWKRLAKPKSISLRKVPAKSKKPWMGNIKLDDFIDINPMNNPNDDGSGWCSGRIIKIDPNSSQIKVLYISKSDGQNYSYWIHLEHGSETAKYKSKAPQNDNNSMMGGGGLALAQPAYGGYNKPNQAYGSHELGMNDIEFALKSEGGNEQLPISPNAKRGAKNNNKNNNPLMMDLQNDIQDVMGNFFGGNANRQTLGGMPQPPSNQQPLMPAPLMGGMPMPSNINKSQSVPNVNNKVGGQINWGRKDYDGSGSNNEDKNIAPSSVKRAKSKKKFGLFGKKKNKKNKNKVDDLKNKIFGVDPLLLQSTYISDYGAPIPNILIKMKQDLYDKKGKDVVGIFRIAPFAEQCRQFERELNSGQYPEMDCASLGNLLKVWFRKLPQPILQSIDSDKIEICKESKDVQMVGMLINTMQEPMKSYYKWMLDLCREIAINENVNKMTWQNMAIVFSPNCYDPSTLDDPMKMMTISAAIGTFVDLSIQFRDQEVKMLAIGSNNIAAAPAQDNGPPPMAFGNNADMKMFEVPSQANNDNNINNQNMPMMNNMMMNMPMMNMGMMNNMMNMNMGNNMNNNNNNINPLLPSSNINYNKKPPQKSPAVALEFDNNKNKQYKSYSNNNKNNKNKASAMNSSLFGGNKQPAMQSSLFGGNNANKQPAMQKSLFGGNAKVANNNNNKNGAAAGNFDKDSVPHDIKVWNGYITKYGHEPTNGSQLQKWTKASKYKNINFTEARDIVNKHKGKGMLDTSESHFESNLFSLVSVQDMIMDDIVYDMDDGGMNKDEPQQNEQTFQTPY